MATSQEPRKIDVGRFQKKVDALASTVAERLKTDWPARLAQQDFARVFLIGSMRAGKCVFAADCYLCADVHREEYVWQ
jgi:hypothetical protein